MKQQTGRNDKEAIYRQIAKWMWLAAGAVLLGICLVFIGLSFTDLPSVQQLENPKSEEASLVIGSNGEVIGRYYTENRVPVTFDQLSPNLVNALIATEDERFYDHSGIDFEALGRIAVKTVLLGQRSSGGGSTITQQLAKLLFTEQVSRNIWERGLQKLKEWIIAVRLEKRYTKEEIIAMYLNKFNFINGAYGIKAASEIYFDKEQDELSVDEAAMLIGMLKNPSLFDPLRRADTVLHRRMVVLKQMEKNELITAEAYDTLRQRPLNLRYTRQSHVDGIAPYFRMELAKDVKRLLASENIRKADGSNYDIYRDGLRIYTTIDPEMQRIAETVMKKHMSQVQGRFWETWGVVNKDPWEYTTSSEHEVPVSIRKAGLQDLLRQSDRYQSLRAQYLDGVLANINEDVELVFHADDREVERIIADEEDGTTIAGLVERNLISTALAAQYRKVKRSPHFPKLKKQWAALQKAVDKAFSTEVDMKVFAYNDRMETDTVMTPLDSIKYHRMILQTGILAVDPVTGQVKVWVGGVGFKYFKYDHNRTSRQVGSTFKPFVYATAIAQQGFSPCYQVYDLPQTITPGDGNFNLLKEWTPRNSDGKYSGQLFTLKEGLKQSKNTVSVHLMKQLGDTEPVRGLVNQMGIDSSARYPNGRYRVPRQPSICLGATDLTNMEMTGAYTTFANNGIFNKPYFIERIEDKDGKKLYEGIPEENVAINPNANHVMVEMLKYSAGVYNVKSEVGGKTGTTNDYVDGWFMGITPSLVVGTWVGGEDRWIRFRSIQYGQGSKMAKPFFKMFLQELEKRDSIDYDPTARFYRPSGDIGIEMDCSEYLRNQLPEDEEENEEFENEGFSEDLFGEDFR
ncbi:transglycosylase domain-containing protein [Phaeodactylibacter luteus]|uniref:Peptidoglycan glycosyltransferase n=1 Tax=Phaeodactylibacter luteus TaxID=1564516 RepID=A0A5C6RTF5_9BACT|nr:transglycosylase domain-containing protein [Phaeodactylibacter luteus]TXB65568.1 peptidoglycan glycosyltransferase [Phaeodactylibacter luteus]